MSPARHLRELGLFLSRAFVSVGHGPKHTQGTHTKAHTAMPVHTKASVHSLDCATPVTYRVPQGHFVLQ